MNFAFQFFDHGVVAVQAMEGNAFFDFPFWVGVDRALRDSLHGNANFIVFFDQFVFQDWFLDRGGSFEFVFELLGVFTGPFGSVEFGFEFFALFEHSFSSVGARPLASVEFGFEFISFVAIFAVAAFEFISFVAVPFGGVATEMASVVFGFEFISFIVAVLVEAVAVSLTSVEFSFEWFGFVEDVLLVVVTPLAALVQESFWFLVVVFAFFSETFAIFVDHVREAFVLVAPPVSQVRSSVFVASEHGRDRDIGDDGVFFGGANCQVHVLFGDGINGHDNTDFLFGIANHDLRDVRLFEVVVFQHEENFVGVVLDVERDVVVFDVDVVFQHLFHFGREFVVVSFVASGFIFASFVFVVNVGFEQVFEGGFDGLGLQGDVIFGVAAGAAPGQAGVGHDFVVVDVAGELRQDGFAVQTSDESLVVFGDGFAGDFHVDFAEAFNQVVHVDQIEGEVARASFDVDFQGGCQRCLGGVFGVEEAGLFGVE